jgi:hypothetical protein
MLELIHTIAYRGIFLRNSTFKIRRSKFNLTFIENPKKH